MTVYFVQAGEGGPVKIGFTEGRAERRVRNLSIGNHEPLRMLSQIPEDLEYEQYLHGIFSPYHVRGEWFKPEGQFRIYLDTVAIPLADLMAPEAGAPAPRYVSPYVGRKTKFTAAQFEQMERLILSKRAHPLSLGRIAYRFKITAPALNYHFPGWRSKSKKERIAHRKARPFPIKRKD